MTITVFRMCTVLMHQFFEAPVVYTGWVRRHIVPLVALMALLSLTPLEARQNRISLGVEDGWRDLAATDGVHLVDGKRGFSDIVLLDGEYAPQDDTDLLMHFNNAAVDVAGGYATTEGADQTSTRMSRMGTGAGVFGSGDRGVILTPLPGSMFSPGTSWGDFSIEFWLYPATLGEGDTVLAWRGSRQGNGRIIPQVVLCSISDRKLAWRFENVFLPPDLSEVIIEVSGRSGLIPRTWHHHLLRFDNTTGLLEYLIDGVPEAIAHVTASGHEDESLYNPLIGDAAVGELEVGPTLNGLLDELRLSRSFNEQPFVDTYAQRTGTAMTGVFDLEFSSSWLTSIDAEAATPGDTEVLFYYRLGEDVRSRQEVIGPWTPFTPGEVFSPDTRGRYVQILVELFPDGHGQKTPSVSNLNIRYEPDLPPHPPAWVEIAPDDGALSVSWQASTDSDVSGYLVYYGSKPGQYFGTESATGPSPIDAGGSTAVNLEGLENGRLYYVAIVSYDGGSPPHMSGFSREEAARPSTMHRRE
jgi:hypothetical protein